MEIMREFNKEIQLLKTTVEAADYEVKLVTDSFQRLIDFARSQNLRKEVAELHSLRGKFYYHNFQQNLAIQDSTNAIEYYIEVKDYHEIARLYNQIGICYHMLMLPEQALNYYTRAYETAVEHNTSNKLRIAVETVNNLILCYRKLHKHDRVLQYITKYKEMDGNNPHYNLYRNEVTLVEANTYRDLKNFEMSDKIYLELLERKEDINHNTLFLIYDNYIIFHLEREQFDKANVYIEKAFEMKDDVTPGYVPWIFITKAKCKMKLAQYDEALETLKIGLNLARQVSTNEMIIEFLFTLVQLNITLKDYESALVELQKVEKFILDNNIKLNNNDLYSFYAEACCGVGEVAKGIEYISKVRKDYISIQRLA